MSTLKINSLQIGQSLTAANNFTWYQPTTPDGTTRLGNGNTGSVTDILTVNSAGNVGIGTSSPSQQLEVNKTAKFGLGNSIGTSAIQFTHSNASALVWQLNSGISGVSHSSMSIGSSVTPAMLNIDSSGNVGIGTSSPNTRLQCIGTVASGGVNGTNGYFQLNRTDAYNLGSIEWITSGDEMRYSNRNGGFHSFYTSNTERMRLDSSGNLGLGVTPKTWSAGKAFEIGANGNGIWSYSGVTRLTQNAYFNTAWTYADTGAAAIYEQVSGTHIWKIAPSGTTGNAISFTQAMTLDASGRLIVGATSAVNSSIATFSGPTVVLLDASGSVLRFNKTAGTDTGWLANRSYNWHDGNGLALATDTADPLRFGTNGSERARIDSSGNLYINCTSNPLTSFGTAMLSINSSGIDGINLKSSGPSNAFNIQKPYNYSNGTMISFSSLGSGGASTQVGAISINGSTTTYATSSDYRLKENIQPMQNALATVALLNPVTFTWKNDGKKGQGFIAHELQSVITESVVGTKDAVDDEGNPVYQAVDTSLLVATLTKAIQELSAKIDSQQNEINTLKSLLNN